ncbi:MAG TPA: epimerase [Bacteroidales bacterium]|nr:epimerase [Bacteroidales bacterium]HBZ20109.1 epimerase [Bacteroidales bacterium]
MSKRLIITGAAGFIGSSLSDSLLKNGLTVLGIDNFDTFYHRSIKERNIETALKSSSFKFMEGDIRDQDFLDRCFSDFRPDVIVHLAAKAGVRPSLIDPKLYLDVNVMGTINILEMMKKNNIRKMIFASSSSVYGNNRKIPFSENDCVDYPVSPYAASKKAGELLCHTYNHLFNLDIFCLRFFTVYGPRQRPDLAIHKFVNALLNDEVITLYGDGTSSRDYTYIDDIVRGISAAIERVKGYQIFNLGNSRPVELTSLVKLLEQSAGRSAHIKYLPMQDGDVERTFADISKAASGLGFNPEISFETGIKNYLKWFKEMKSDVGGPDLTIE